MCRLFGFRYEGIDSGSFASNYQSICYGGDTPGGGWFAWCQRRGTREPGCCYWILNFVLFLIGALFIVIGVVSDYYPNSITFLLPQTYFDNDFIRFGFFQIDKLLIASGFFICFSLIFTCFGSVSCLQFIPIILVTVCIVIISVSVNQYQTETLLDRVSDEMLNEIKDFDDAPDNIMNIFQHDLECCDVMSYSDCKQNKK